MNTENINKTKVFAEQGDATAQYDLGRCYFYGEGVSTDKGEAVKWLAKAAEQGFPAAQYYLGYCYDNGTGVSIDKCKANELYIKAAEFGHVEAQNVLKSKKVRFKIKHDPAQPKGLLPRWLYSLLTYPLCGVIAIICGVMYGNSISFLFSKFPQLATNYGTYSGDIGTLLSIALGVLLLFLNGSVCSFLESKGLLKPQKRVERSTWCSVWNQVYNGTIVIVFFACFNSANSAVFK